MSSLGSDCGIECPEENQKPPGEEGGYPSAKGTVVLGSPYQGQAVAMAVPIQGGFLKTLRSFPLMGSGRTSRKKSSEPTHFLQACFLCKRRLVPGKDIYMYMGDSAFCSIECRNQQILIDENKDKCCVVMMKQDSVSTSQHQNNGNKNGTVAAA